MNDTPDIAIEVDEVRLAYRPYLDRKTTLRKRFTGARQRTRPRTGAVTDVQTSPEGAVTSWPWGTRFGLPIPCTATVRWAVRVGAVVPGRLCGRGVSTRRRGLRPGRWSLWV